MRARYYEDTFCELLINDGLLSAERLNRLLGEREDATEPVADMLVRRGLLSERDRARYIGRQLGIPYVDLTSDPPDPQIGRLIPNGMAQRLMALPIERSATAVSVALADPLDIAALDELRASTGLEVDPFIASREDLQAAIDALWGAEANLAELVAQALGVLPGLPRDDDEFDGLRGDLETDRETAPVVRLANEVLQRAVVARASDIHFSPEENGLRVRYRVDGILQEVSRIPRPLQSAVISRLKIMAGLDIAERRAPQDGRISMRVGRYEYDFRISTYPSLHGENVVLRILDKRSGWIALDRLGIPQAVQTRLRELIFRPYGMVLVCGPTGSGKTTTLYACLNALNGPERNIMTIEDPVEYQLEGIIQGGVNPKAGVTFASGLRSLVRQDPDVLMIGEIRDAETARIAVEAALTGHLVLSTIHANDSAGAITRLIDMGIEPFLVASALLASVTQRLLRVNCPRCVSPALVTEEVWRSLGVPDRLRTGARVARGTGCDSCRQTGYRGRAGVYELLEVGDTVRRLILEKASSQEMRAVAVPDNATLRYDALTKLCDGLTTPEEVARVTVL